MDHSAKHSRVDEERLLGLILGNVGSPTAQTIAGTVARLLREGKINDGARLPAVRELAANFSVSPATISQAWTLLRERGLAHGRGKAGVTVSAFSTVDSIMGSSMHVDSRDLRHLTPDPSLLPSRLTDALQESLHIKHVNTYSTIPILAELEDAVRETWPYNPQSFLSTHGGSDGLALTLRALTVPGDRVVIQNPTAPTVLRLLRNLSLIGVPVEEDDLGPTPAGLRHGLSTQPSVFLIQPKARVPTGSVVNDERAEELAYVLYRSDTNIVEFDDINQLSRFDSSSIGTWLPGRTVLIRSFSKSHGPDLRIGVIGGAQHHIQAIYTRINAGRSWSSKIMQGAVAWMLKDETTKQEIQTAQREYFNRLNTLHQALTDRSKTLTDTDGLCLWLPVKNEEGAIQYLKNHGYLTFPGQRNYLGEGPPHIRVATARLSTKVESLAALLSDVKR